VQAQASQSARKLCRVGTLLQTFTDIERTPLDTQFLQHPDILANAREHIKIVPGRSKTSLLRCGRPDMPEGLTLPIRYQKKSAGTAR